MSCYSRPPIWSLGDVRTFSLPNQWAVCVCVSPMQEAFVELYDRQRDSVFSCSWPSIKTVFGMAALGAASLTIGAYLAQKWSGLQPPPPFSPPAFYFPSSFALRLSSLLLKTLLTPSEKNLQTSPSQIGLSSKGLFPPSALRVKTEGSQKTGEAKWWSVKRRAGPRCDRSGGVKRGDLFLLFFCFFLACLCLS